MNDWSRFAYYVCWVLPGVVAGLNWGLAIGLVTFGSQSFAAPALVRMYIAWRASTGSVDPEDVQRFNLVANLLAGTVFAVFARLIIGDELP